MRECLTRLLLIVGCLLTSEFALAAEQFYSLEFLQTGNRTKVREQALIVSGIVEVPCRVTTSAGVFYLRCGKEQELAPIQAEFERLKKLGLDKITLIQIKDDAKEVVHTYLPIDVGPDAQANLLSMVRQQSTFEHQTRADAKKEPDMLAQAKRLRELDKGNTLVSQGWLAYENQDLKNAIKLFSEAAKMDTVRLPALFGLSLSYFNDAQYQQALEPFRRLLEEGYEVETVLPLYLQAALNTNNLDIVKTYYQKLPKDQQVQWLRKLEQIEMEKAFDLIKKRPTRGKLLKFMADNQKYLKNCEPVSTWDALGKRLVNFKAYEQAKALYAQMWQSCFDEGVRVGILYQLNKISPFEKQQLLLNAELGKNISNAYRRKLNDYRYNSLMAQADAQPKGSDEAGKIYSQIGRPYNVYNRYKLAKAWWSYQREDYQNAMADFSWLWHNRDHREALKGMLFSMMKLGQIDNAVAIAHRQHVPDMKLILYKEKLASLEVPSQASYELAHNLLQEEPNYIPALSALGWNAINAKQWPLARTYFKRWQALEPNNEGALTGLMQSYSKQQMFDDAFALAQRLDKPGEYNWQYNVQFEKGLKLFNDKIYDKAESIFSELLALKPKDRGLQTLYSWSLFHQKKYKKSAKRFLALYNEDEDKDVAQGYISSLDKLNKVKKKQAFVDEMARSDKPDNRSLAAGQYVTQKDFLRAAFADQSPDQYYTGVDNTEFWLDYNYRHKNGDHGISSLGAKHLQLGASFVWRPGSRLYLTLNYEALDADLRSQSPFLGNDFTYGQIPPEFPGADLTAMSTKDGVWYPFARYRREDYWDLDMGVGLSPLSSPLTSKLVWFFTAEKDADSFSIYRRPMFDSQLNYVGIKDPYSTKKWGRVLETGVKYRRSGMVTDDFWFSGSGEYNRYAGSNVISNQGAKAELMVGRDFPAESMALSGGLSATASGYQRNSIFYSFGHGGYFSPQAMWQAGLFTHMESKKHVVDWWELDLSVGYFQWRTKAHERYPFGLFKQMDNGDTGSGMSYLLRGEKHWRLTENFELGIAGELTRSPGYEKWRAGLILRYFWKDHSYLMNKHHVIRPWAL